MTEAALLPEPLVGRPAPFFDLPCVSRLAPNHRRARLADYRGRWLVLMFYPRDFSMVCPTELSAMSRRPEFAALGADVLAVSTDSVDTHTRWLDTPRSRGGMGTVTFPLASDQGGDVSRAYRACLSPNGVALRALFMIDPNGIVQYQVVHNLNVGRHTDEVLRVLTALQTGGLCAEGWETGQPTIDTSHLEPGTMVAHYRIDQKLGDGGFASVYLAKDQTLRRPVALKLLRPTDGWTPDLLSEARAAAALNHPNVCTIYGVDDTEGTPMIVMEPLKGRTLAELVTAGPTAPLEVARIGCQVAAGMAAAHAAGIVHGDLKPANVMLTHEGTVKILDFGIVARHRSIQPEDPTLSLGTSSTPGFLGSPRYMAPEQTAGRHATAESDVFAFGVLLYELLTGRSAFEGSNVLAVLEQVRRCPADVLAADVAPPFDDLLCSMLRPDPSSRTVTMQAIAERLTAAALDRPRVSETPVSAGLVDPLDVTE